MTNVISTSFDTLICAIRELEMTQCPNTFLKRCMHETEKFNDWNRYLFQPFTWGKYGAIGKLSRDGETVKIGEVPLVVKTNRQPIKDIKIKYSDKTLVLDDNIAEIVFAALIKMLYDFGACPFYVRYAGYFLKKPLVYLFSEKCSFEFSHILQRQRDGNSIAVKRPRILMNCIFQAIYAMYVYKAYFDIIHFDTHIRNVMLKVNSRESYRDVRWSDCKYIVFRDERTKRAIVLKHNGYVVKLLDFGLCFASLDKRHLIASNIRVESYINAHRFVSTPSKANTIDVMYFLLHVYQYMNFGLDKNFGSTTTDFSADRRYFSTLLNLINDFSSHFFGEPFSTFADANVPDRNSEGKLLYLLKQHDVGVESNFFNRSQGLIEGLIRYCKASGYVRNECVINGVSGYSVFSHEPVADFSFDKNHCMILDAGVGMKLRAEPGECASSVQWWSVDAFDTACRSLQHFTSDCNIMYWIAKKPPTRGSCDKKTLVVSSPPRSNSVSFSKDSVPLKRIVFQNNHPKHFIRDSYKKRNFMATFGENDDRCAVVCFGTHHGSISISKACELFSKLNFHTVYEFFEDVSICVYHKNRITRIVGKSDDAQDVRTLTLCVLKGEA